MPNVFRPIVGHGCDRVIAAQVDQRVDGNAVPVHGGGHGVSHVHAGTEADENKMRLRVLLMNAADLLLEIRCMKHLAVVSLAKA